MFVRLKENIKKYWDGNAVYIIEAPVGKGLQEKYVIVIPSGWKCDTPPTQAEVMHLPQSFSSSSYTLSSTWIQFTIAIPSG